MPFKNNSLLAITDYPLYCVKALNNRYFLVAGGGGCSKTGVDNSLAIYEIEIDNQRIYGKIVSLLDMGLYAPMNMAHSCIDSILGEYFLALGLGDICQTFHLQRYIQKNIDEKLIEKLSTNQSLAKKNLNLRHRKRYDSDASHNGKLANGSLSNGHLPYHKASHNKSRSSLDLNIISNITKKNGVVQHFLDENKEINDVYVNEKRSNYTHESPKYELKNEFKLIHLHSVTTDTHKITAHQKTVKICSDRKFIITGGTDGFIRIWNMDTLAIIREIKAHENEIDDLEIHPTKPHIVSLSRDGHAYVWNSEDGSKICELKWSLATRYRFRACRYQTASPQTKLYTVHIPCTRAKVRQPSYLTEWEILESDLDEGFDNKTDYRICDIKVTGNEESYILALDYSGKYLAIGTSDGSVSIYTTNDLKVSGALLQTKSGPISDWPNLNMQFHGSSLIRLALFLYTYCHFISQFYPKITNF
ncbi:uncharacterized protein LOC135929514 isoform X2 [Gordionus sp. m RMFG-2023]|uniref:uncharacterized protein LOC135929514 isoform X2 n=1 Tax=Gordionus sp. m RMFG-2023 TaxID=3053472 RepID=UPI0031FDCC74